MQFITEKEHLKICQDWLTTGTLTIQSDPQHIELTNPFKYQILKAFFASPYFTNDEKKGLLQQALQDDSSEEALSTSLICGYSLPDPELKQQLWEQITDPSPKQSLKEVAAKV